MFPCLRHCGPDIRLCHFGIVSWHVLRLSLLMLPSKIFRCSKSIFIVFIHFNVTYKWSLHQPNESFKCSTKKTSTGVCISFCLTKLIKKLKRELMMRFLSFKNNQTDNKDMQSRHRLPGTIIGWIPEGSIGKSSQSECCSIASRAAQGKSTENFVKMLLLTRFSSHAHTRQNVRLPVGVGLIVGTCARDLTGHIWKSLSCF